MQHPDVAAAAPETTPGAALREGLTHPSLLGLGIAALVAVAPFVALAATIDEAYMASPAHAALAINERDYGLDATSNVLRGARTPSTRARIALVGASSTRASVNAPALEREIERLTGRQLEVLNLTFGGQSLVESLALLERLEGTGPLVAVVAAGMGRIGKGRTWASGPTGGSRVGIRSERMDAVVRESGYEPRARSGIYCWDNRAFVLPRVPWLLLSMVAEPAELKVIPAYGEHVLDAAAWRRRTRVQAGRFESYPENADRGSATLREIAEYDRRHDDVAVLILHSPVNPRFVEECGLADRYADAHRRLDELHAATGVPVLRLWEEAGITADDYVDGTHLRVPETIDRYTRILAQRIVASGALDEVESR